MALVWGIPALYIVLCVVLWALQEKITFPAPRAALRDPAQTLGYGERVELMMHDGTKVVGWYLPPLAAPRRPFAALLWFYGNGETIAAIPRALVNGDSRIRPATSCVAATCVATALPSERP